MEYYSAAKTLHFSEVKRLIRCQKTTEIQAKEKTSGLTQFIVLVE